jgi:DNA invertase Pin-like site-specific DNA recombinase
MKRAAGATGKFLLQQMAAVAELEAGMISARTKAALAAAKRRGVKLGGDRGARLTAKARAAGRAAVQVRARNRALDLAPTIQELQAAGCASLRALAAGLEERGIPAPRGGKWSAVQVARLLEAAAVPFDASAGASEETARHRGVIIERSGGFPRSD